MRKSNLILLVVILLVAGTVITVRAGERTVIYLPEVYRQATYTPTFTLTPTRTATPTRTPRPASINILKIWYPNSYYNERVEIKNEESIKVELTGWRLKSESKGLVYIFPKFTLDAGKTVLVWTKIGEDFSNNLFWNQSEAIFTSPRDCVYLKDDDNRWVDDFCLNN